MPDNKKRKESVTFNINLPEHKSDGSSKVWLAAVGTALSGLAATWTAVKPPPQTVPAPPAPQPKVSFAEPEYKPLSMPVVDDQSTELERLFQTFASREAREKFVRGIREADARGVASEATDGEKAISTLLDPEEDPAHRISAALYLGGHGKREYYSPLKVTAAQDDTVGMFARVALDMIRDEHLDSPARRVPRTLDIPAISKK
jgi:hypothetical protein